MSFSLGRQGCRGQRISQHMSKVHTFMSLESPGYFRRHKLWLHIKGHEFNSTLSQQYFSDLIYSRLVRVIRTSKLQAIQSTLCQIHVLVLIFSFVFSFCLSLSVSLFLCFHPTLDHVSQHVLLEDWHAMLGTLDVWECLYHIICNSAYTWTCKNPGLFSKTLKKSLSLHQC